MSELIAITYPDQNRAEEVLAALRRLQGAYLVDLEDAAYVTKNSNGKLKLHQTHDLTATGAVGGGLWGMLIGLLFFAPFLGLALGAGAGALMGKVSDYGINDQFAKSLTSQMQPGSSALLILVRSVTPDKVIPEFAKYGGTLIHTTLSKESEERLQAALEHQENNAPVDAAAPNMDTSSPQ
jgi:uncharacterized membrane protein